MNNLQVMHEQEVLGKNFRVYNHDGEPLFLAKDVAEWIEIKNTAQMLNAVEEEEKTLYTMYTPNGKPRQNWFLTEDGLYEVLMQSRKPIAKEFKKKVKHILKSRVFAKMVVIWKLLRRMTLRVAHSNVIKRYFIEGLLENKIK